VIRVTTLADSGAGSLRDACEAQGPRRVELAVVIGSKAPADGVCLRRSGIDTRTT
jgi:hypothetical protein